MTPSAATGRRAGLDHDEVVDAALALVDLGGPDALTMRKLAAELGVTTTTIYWHAGNREELVLAVVRRRAEQRAAAPITGATPRARIASIATHIWQGALEQPNVTALAYRAGAIDVLERHAQQALAAELAAAGVRGRAARDAMQAILLCVAGFLVVGMGSLPGTGAPNGTVPPPDRRLFDRTIGAVIDAFVPEEGP